MSASKARKDSGSYYKSSLVFLVLSLLSALFNYAYYPLIARFLSPSDFGAVQSLIAVLLQIGSIFAGLNLVTIYLVNKLDYDSAKKGIETIQKLTTSFFVIVTLAVTVFQSPVLKFLHINNHLFIFILALDLITTIPFIIAFGYLQARRKFATAGSLQLTVVLIKLLAGALGAKAYGPSGALAGIAVGQVVGMLLFWAAGNVLNFSLWDHQAFASLKPPAPAELRSLSPLAGNLTAVFMVNLLFVIYVSFGIIAGRHYFTPHISGLLAGALILANGIVFVCQPLIGVLLPHLSPNSLAASRRDLVRTGSLVGAAIAAGIIFLAIFGSPMLRLFGQDYSSMNYLLIRLATMSSLIAGLALVLPVGVFYAPRRLLGLSILGLAGLIWAAYRHHDSPFNLANSMIWVFVVILLVGILQIIWTYRYGQRPRD